jgi:hypothetical protein
LYFVLVNKLRYLNTISMKRPNLLSAVFMMLLFLSGPVAFIAGQSSKCVAVVTEIKGNVLIKEFNKTEFKKVFWGAQLFQGDQIRTDDNSMVSMLFANSNLIRLEANSSMTLPDNKTTSSIKTENIPESMSAAMVSGFSTLISRRDSREEKGALAGLRAGITEQAIVPDSPCNTFIRTLTPSFAWSSNKPFDKLTINLYNSKGLVWSSKSSGSIMKYPGNEKPLEFGESYFWNVEGEDLLENVRSGNFKFSVLSNDKVMEVEKQTDLIRKTFNNEPENSSLHSVLGSYFINEGLMEDAINEFQIIAKINKDSPMPHEILGSIYSDIGKKDKAIEELQKALELTGKQIK